MFFDPVMNLKRSIASPGEDIAGLVRGLQMIEGGFMEALRKLETPKTVVVRSGRTIEVDARQIAPGDVLHRQERLSCRGDAGIVEPRDAGMLEPRQDALLLAHPTQRVRVDDAIHDLQRHFALEVRSRLFGQIDRRAAAPPDAALDSKARHFRQHVGWCVARRHEDRSAIELRTGLAQERQHLAQFQGQGRVALCQARDVGLALALGEFGQTVEELSQLEEG